MKQTILTNNSTWSLYIVDFKIKNMVIPFSVLVCVSRAARGAPSQSKTMVVHALCYYGYINEEPVDLQFPSARAYREAKQRGLVGTIRQRYEELYKKSPPDLDPYIQATKYGDIKDAKCDRMVAYLNAAAGACFVSTVGCEWVGALYIGHERFFVDVEGEAEWSRLQSGQWTTGPHGVPVWEETADEWVPIADVSSVNPQLLAHYNNAIRQ